jgi:DNA-binding transcriptional MerR regulator
MEYTATEISEVTGVPLRTIRLWTERRLVPPPSGRGPGTRYTEEHRILVRAIAEMRTQTHQLKVIKKVIRKMSREEILCLIGEEPEVDEAEEEKEKEAAQRTEPAVPPAPAQGQALPRAESAAPPLPPANSDAGDRKGANGRIETRARAGEAPLPEGARWVIVGLLPQLALMVGEGASPLVRRVAAEICKEYGEG